MTKWTWRNQLGCYLMLAAVGWLALAVFCVGIAALSVGTRPEWATYWEVWVVPIVVAGVGEVFAFGPRWMAARFVRVAPFAAFGGAIGIALVRVFS